MSKFKNVDEYEKESFQNVLFPKEMNAVSTKEFPQLYQRLINKAKAQKNIAGALYLAAETLPFDVPNGNFKTVKWDKEAKTFVKSMIAPYPLPVIYNHEDGTGWSGSDDAPNTAGRVLAFETASVKQGKQSLHTGQLITNKETIERVHDMLDYSQSISFMPKGYICNECNCDVSGDCDHYPGEKIAGTDRRVQFTVVPAYAVELSFVTVPAFRDAQIRQIEQNARAAGIDEPIMSALYSYNKKEDTVPVNINLNELNNNTDESSSDQNNNNEQGDENMDKELKETLSQLTKKVDDLASKVDASSTNTDTINTDDDSTDDNGTDDTTDDTTDQSSSEVTLALNAVNGLVDQNKALIEQNQSILEKLNELTSDKDEDQDESADDDAGSTDESTTDTDETTDEDNTDEDDAAGDTTDKTSDENSTDEDDTTSDDDKDKNTVKKSRVQNSTFVSDLAHKRGIDLK